MGYGLRLYVFGNFYPAIYCFKRNYTLLKCNKVTRVSYIILKIQAMGLRNPWNLVFIPNMGDAWYICLKKVSLQKA